MEADALKLLTTRVAETKDGKEFLTWLMTTCGYDQSSMVVHPEMGLDMNAILFHEAKRNVWLAVRYNIPKPILREIEIGDE